MNFTFKKDQTKEVPLSQYDGKVLLILNTASQCGFTPQYKELQELHEKYSGQGLAILCFPCNQFGKQEPGNDEEIKNFCDLSFNITFPIFSKIEVNGGNAHPFFIYLKEQAPGVLGSKAIKWNFTKFLVSKDRNIIKRFAPKSSPLSLESEIEALLKAKL